MRGRGAASSQRAVASMSNNSSVLAWLSVKLCCECMFLIHSEISYSRLLFVIEVNHATSFGFPFVADFVGSEVRQIVLSGKA